MKVFELRAYLKERRIKGYSTLRKEELEERVKKLKEQERARKYEENLTDTALCSTCLEQQRIQRKIDEKTFNQRLLESAVRTLVCKHCRHEKFVVDGDQTVCVDCGSLQDSDAVAAVRYQQ